MSCTWNLLETNEFSVLGAHARSNGSANAKCLLSRLQSFQAGAPMEEKMLLPVYHVNSAKEALASSSTMEVTCKKSVHKVGTNWLGTWTFVVITPVEGAPDNRAPLVKWRNLEPKVITTINGLTGLAVEVGAHVPEFPLLEGQVAFWKGGSRQGS